MDYKAAKYNENGTIDCEIDHPRYGWIPTTLSAADPDTAALFALVAAGEVEPYRPPEPAPPQPPTVPQRVSRFQARAALYLAGLLEQVEELMADPTTDPLAKMAWQDALEFRRHSPTVLAMAAALGLTEQQLDELFITAATIEA